MNLKELEIVLPTEERRERPGRSDQVYDLIIIGGGTSRDDRQRLCEPEKIKYSPYK